MTGGSKATARPNDDDNSVRAKFGSVQTHWIAESGIVDLFLMPGPGPDDVAKQYYALTGRPQLPPLFALVKLINCCETVEFLYF